MLLRLRQRRSIWSLLIALICFPGTLFAAWPASTNGGCRQVVFEGSVSAGQGFDQVFAAGLRFYLEPLRSGWIIRVLKADGPRDSHDYAELATPPYQSVNPLLITTDWAFRAQDAVAWNPRHFRFAGDRAAFKLLESLQPAALDGDAKSTAGLARLVAEQPEGALVILDARFAPGTADQAKMASAVALHLLTTPHVADNAAAPSALGRLEWIHFRVSLDLGPSARPVKGTLVRSVSCHTQPS